ncbi:MAG: sugar phosphate isomerase/epimerase family protein [Phycisphaerae bacterium]
MIYKAVNYWTFGPLALEGKYDVIKAMREAKDAGFCAIELCVSPTGELPFNAKEKYCRKLGDQAAKIGIKICGVASGVYWGVSPSDPKKSIRAKALKYTMQGLQITRWLGADAFLYVPGAVKPEFMPDAVPVPYGEVYQNALETAKAAEKFAQKVKVFLCVENVWNMFLYSPVEMRDFIKRIGGKYAGCYFDPANVVKNGFPDHWIPVLGKMIKRVHCKDYKRVPGGFPEGFEVPIGKGETNWSVIVKQLQKIGYNGPVTAEIISFTEDPSRVKRVSKEMDSILA